MEKKLCDFWERCEVDEFWKIFHERTQSLSKTDQVELQELMASFHVWVQNQTLLLTTEVF
jgi:hypothetical protein